MTRRRLILQLRIIQTVLQVERANAPLPAELRERAAGLIEQTAIAIEAEPDPLLQELLANVRRELARD